jgi:uncharacterized coiled-coil protein SlyX
MYAIIMQYYRILIAFLALISWTTFSADAQVQDTGDNVGIGTPATAISSQLFGKLDVRGDNIFLSPSTSNLFPSFPNQFIGIGQSGGSCGLWGFRAQRKAGPAGNFINMGVQPDGNSTVSNPFISWGGCVVPRATKDPILVGDPVPVPFCQRRNLDFRFDDASGGCGTVVVQMSNNSNKLRVFGRARFDGNILVNGTTYSSDQRFKQNINPINNALSLVNSIQGHTYEFKRKEFPDRNFSDKLQFGFIAQELLEVAPNLVHQEEDGYYSVDYVAMVPVLVEAIKEQNDQVAELQNTLSQQQEDINFLKAELTRLMGQLNQSNTGRTGSSSDLESPLLFQNAPNPFQEVTTLRAFIPGEVQKAEIMVYDLQGKIVQRQTVEARGMTESTINGSSLSAGTYLYTLVVDGNTIDTKRMTLTN